MPVTVTRIGGEIVIGGTSLSVENMTIVQLSNGGFVASWDVTEDGYYRIVKAQVFDADGASVGEEFQVNTLNSPYWNGRPEITPLANGGFVIVWHQGQAMFGGVELPDGEDSEVRAQAFDASGARIGAEFLVNTHRTDTQYDHDIAGLANGGFVVTWETSDDAQDGSYGAIKAQLFDANGAKTGGEFRVNSDAFGNQTNPAVTGLANGGFVVTWESLVRSGSYGIPVKAQIFNASGTKVGSEFQINSYSADDSRGPTIIALTNGSFVATWVNQSRSNPNNYSGPWAQVFSESGTRVGESFLIGGSITALANGAFIDVSITRGESSATITGQLFDATGAKIGDEILIEDSAYLFTSVAVSQMPQGGFIVSWQEGEGGRTTKAQIYNVTGVQPPPPPPITGTSAGETLTGTAKADVMNGLGGNDLLIGLAGNDNLDGGTGADRMEGGAGNDVYFVDNAGDVVIELAGQGTDRVNTTVTWSAAGQDIENIAITGTGRINVVGNDLNNVMTGNDDVNALNGGRGADRMVGGKGNDLYYVDNIGDVVVERAGEGTDTIRASVTVTLAANVERLQVVGSQQVNAIGNELDNVLQGNARSNVIIGMGGRDLMTGGGGADRFDFRAVSDSPFAAYDRITDLEAQDVINLSRIDANVNVAGDQAFVIVDAFTRQAGQLTLSYHTTGGFTVLTADVDGDGRGDFRVILDGDHTEYRNFML